MAMDVLVSKIASLFVLLLCTLLFGFLPFIVIKHGSGRIQPARYEKILQLLNSFAGGVFLGTCFLHLLAEGREELVEALAKLQVNTEYPLFETVTAVGFFLIVIVDYIAKLCLNINTQGHEDEERNPLLTKSSDTYQSFGNEVNKHCQRPRSNSTASTHSHDVSRLAGIQSTMKALLLLVALSFHTVFDGLAVGLQYTSVDVWQVMIAVGIHKSLVAFCLGLQLFNAYIDRPLLAGFMLLLFSLMSPIGVGIGLGLTSDQVNNASKLLASAVLQAVATGTFLYVTFFEILRESFVSKNSIWNIFVCIIGFAGMAGVKFLDAD